MKLDVLAADPESLARELQTAFTDGENKAGLPSRQSGSLPFQPFGQQMEFAQRFLRIVQSAQEDRQFAPSELLPITVRNQYHGKSPKIEVMLPARPFCRDPAVHHLFGVSGSGKTETLERLQRLISRDTAFDPKAVALPITIPCESVHTVEDVYSHLLTGLDQVLLHGGIKAAAWGRTTKLSDVPDNIVKVCLGHRLTCLIVDEVEYLTELPAVHQRELVRFLLRLSTEAGVPIFLVGTAAGWDFVANHHDLSKALVGIPRSFWDAHSNSAEWKVFVRLLWTFYFGEGFADHQKIQDSIYYHTQGIPRLAHVLLKSAITADRMQRIHDVPESDRPNRIMEVLGEVAADELHAVQHILEALRSGDPALMRAYRHYGPFDLDYSELEAKHRAKLDKELREAEEQRKSESELELLRSLSRADNDNEHSGEALTLALEIVVRSIGEELGCTPENTVLYAEQAIDELKASDHRAEPHTHPKSYLKKVLGRLEADRKARAAQLKQDKATKQRTIGAKDLRWVLRAGRGVSKALERAGYRPQVALERISHGAADRS